MISGFLDVYYNVKDMNKAVDFYVNTLNMTKKFGDEYWTELDCNGVSVGLHGTEGQDVPNSPRDDHGSNVGATLTLKSDNISADKETLSNAGAKIVSVADQPWGEMLVFEDSDGNILKLMNPKC